MRQIVGQCETKRGDLEVIKCPDGTYQIEVAAVLTQSDLTADQVIGILTAAVHAAYYASKSYDAKIARLEAEVQQNNPWAGL